MSAAAILAACGTTASAALLAGFPRVAGAIMFAGNVTALGFEFVTRRR